MSITDAENILKEYLYKREQRLTDQRRCILSIFLKAQERLSIEELYQKTREKQRRIGLTTVYRTIKLLCECGLAEGFRDRDGALRYELSYGYYTHFTCIRCKRVINVENARLKALQKQIVQKYQCVVLHSRLDFYGVCSDCYSKQSCRRSEIERRLGY